MPERTSALIGWLRRPRSWHLGKEAYLDIECWNLARSPVWELVIVCDSLAIWTDLAITG
ncbi:hypothetical protein M406DRAFT_57296 [Cryphonectria parasitica EP155]|uniref:Uncharacterized protein n=1 Tax=Cryphonectria parasitica (strain ATCC 38755 / EP155) TaxID=660469 RepID=A0A9P5CMT5_CRYP1|nr:uncharacterized protein M406DRAFT_57296 [Cryphonectria parasitica EP155]KAF3763220.1 hypothetical protein M406DRAFT_57296 [Cryphonectria parasitica EP155]